MFPVTNNTANQGGTRLIPASQLTPGLRAAVSGEPVVSTTLGELVTFANADTVIMKLDIEVRNIKFDSDSTTKGSVVLVSTIFIYVLF